MSAEGAGDFPAEFGASTRTGDITVRTTEMGLPLGITLEPDQLQQEPDALATEILRLCTQSAHRAGMLRRKQLAEAGFTPEMLALTGLPTEAEVAREEIVAEQEYDTEPESWLRSV